MTGAPSGMRCRMSATAEPVAARRRRRSAGGRAFGRAVVGGLRSALGLVRCRRSAPRRAGRSHRGPIAVDDRRRHAPCRQRPTGRGRSTAGAVPGWAHEPKAVVLENDTGHLDTANGSRGRSRTPRRPDRLAAGLRTADVRRQALERTKEGADRLLPRSRATLIGWRWSGWARLLRRAGSHCRSSTSIVNRGGNR